MLQTIIPTLLVDRGLMFRSNSVYCVVVNTLHFTSYCWSDKLAVNWSWRHNIRKNYMYSQVTWTDTVYGARRRVLYKIEIGDYDSVFFSIFLFWNVSVESSCLAFEFLPCLNLSMSAGSSLWLLFLSCLNLHVVECIHRYCTWRYVLWLCGPTENFKIDKERKMPVDTQWLQCIIISYHCK